MMTVKLLLFVASAAMFGASVVVAHGGPARADATPPRAVASRSEIAAGRRIFAAVGCYQCHGYAGQGGNAGPALAGLSLSDAAIKAYIRAPRRVMPAFGAAILPDASFPPLLAYIRSLGGGRAAADIPLLAGYVRGVAPAQQAARPAAAPATADPDIAQGGALFQANCAACHGDHLQGVIGPDLHGEAGKRTLEQTVQFIISPPPGMPKLSPQPLSEAQVRLVARYVRAQQ
ncbi:hypothetical protein EAH87_00960 [Sphingomonas koreensis]|nr:hypothetical protein EAH87_00960 [Sphingomonas koreensis]